MATILQNPVRKFVVASSSLMSRNFKEPNRYSIWNLKEPRYFHHRDEFIGQSISLFVRFHFERRAIGPVAIIINVGLIVLLAPICNFTAEWNSAEELSLIWSPSASRSCGASLAMPGHARVCPRIYIDTILPHNSASCDRARTKLKHKRGALPFVFRISRQREREREREKSARLLIYLRLFNASVSDIPIFIERKKKKRKRKIMENGAVRWLFKLEGEEEIYQGIDRSCERIGTRNSFSRNWNYRWIKIVFNFHENF